MTCMPPLFRKSHFGAAACFAAASLFAQESFAQDLGTPADEIVVTAQKRSESIQNVGASINAFSGDSLERLAVRDSNEVLLRVPNLEIQSNNASTNANIFIRGLGTSGPGFNTRSGVGIYSDEVSLNSPVVNILQTYDMERIEVIRGPQNTLYGRNTTGGAVNFISRKPVVGDSTNGYLSVTGGRFNQLDFEGALAGALGDNAAARLSFQTQSRQGIRENLFLGDSDTEREKYAGRLQILFEPTDNLSVLLKGHAEKVDGTNIRWKNIGLLDPAGVAPTQTSVIVSFSCPNPIGIGGNCVDVNGFRDTADIRTNSANMQRPINAVDAYGASGRVDLDLGGAVLTSITAFETNDYENKEDSDASPATFFHFNQNSDADQISQELRLVSRDDQDFRWILGGYFFHEDSVGETGPVFAGMNMVNLTRLALEDTVYSAYAEVEKDLGDRFTAIVGFRYTYEKLEGTNNTLVRILSDLRAQGLLAGIDSDAVLAADDGQNVLTFDELNNLPFSMGQSINIDLGDNWGEWGGKFGVEYKASDDVLLYATASRGFKGGNFSAAPLQAIAGTAGTPVDPEIVWTYEGGFKASFAEGIVTFNGSVFYNDYKNQQVLRVTNSPGFGLAAALVNIPGSEIYGAELDAQFAPGGGFFLNAGLGLLDSEISSFIDDAGNDFSGNKLTNAPSLTIYAGLLKEFEFANGAVLGIGGDVRYASERQFDLSNDPLLADNGYATVNLQAFYQFGPDNRYRASLWGKNVTNELWIQNKSDLGGGIIQAVISEPATFGGTLQVNF